MPDRYRLALRLLLALLLAAPCATPLRAAGRDPDQYALRVHIYDKHQSHNAKWHYYSGHGRANLFEGDQVNAMEYSFECTYAPLTSEGGEDYPAKWKKPGLSIEVLMGVIGSDTSTRTCELKVALKDYVFLHTNGKLTQISQQEYMARQQAHAEHDQALAPQDTDPSHYPLELSLLNITWTDSTGGMHTGSGQGDLKTPSGIAAVDFVLRCPVVVQTTPEGRYYRGQWREPGHEMLLLLGNLADPASAATCQVTTLVHPDVYIRRATGIIKAVSQDQYKQLQNP